jgi:hypothetical protein
MTLQFRESISVGDAPSPAAGELMKSCQIFRRQLFRPITLSKDGFGFAPTALCTWIPVAESR